MQIAKVSIAVLAVALALAGFASASDAPSTALKESTATKGDAVPQATVSDVRGSKESPASVDRSWLDWMTGGYFSGSTKTSEASKSEAEASKSEAVSKSEAEASKSEALKPKDVESKRAEKDPQN